jgi:hypothetical protein
MTVMERRRRRWASPEFQQKIRARHAIQFCVKKGWIVRPKLCPRCDSKRMIEGHHPDYSKPLEVVWLCRECHDTEHHG